MPHELQRFYVRPNPVVHGAVSLSLTNELTHPGDQSSHIQVDLLIDEGTPVSEPQIEVSLTHA